MASLEAQIEKFWKDQLDAWVTDLPVFVSRREEAVEWDKSYVVCQVDKLEEIYPAQEVYRADIQIWLLTNIDDALTEDHQAALQDVKDAINTTLTDSTFPFNAPAGCRVYGWATKTVEKEEYKQAYGDVIYIEGGFGIARN